MKIPYVIGLVEKTDFDAKIIETENQIPSYTGSIKNLIIIRKLGKLKTKDLALLVQSLKLIMTQILEKSKGKLSVLLAQSRN